MENQSESSRLKRLSSAALANLGSKDVRGWEVIEDSGKIIGKVVDLFIDVENAKVRYIDILLIPELSLGHGNRHIVIPVGAAKLHDVQNILNVAGIGKDALKIHPHYTGGPITLDYEHELRESILSNYRTQVNYPNKNSHQAPDPKDFYNHAFFMDDHLENDSTH